MDHLEPGELDYELFLRNVVIGDDESRGKRRRRLRQILREESDGHEFIIHYDQDPEVDLGICKRLLSEICRILSDGPRSQVEICRSRLLHLGHRLAVIKNHAVGDLKNQSNAEFSKVLGLFSEHFWSEEQFFTVGGDSASEADGLLDEAAGREEAPVSARGSSTGAIPKNTDSSRYVSKADFSRAMTDIGSLIQALSSQVNGLKEEIRKQRTPPPIPPRPSLTPLNSTNPFLDNAAPSHQVTATLPGSRSADGRDSCRTNSGNVPQGASHRGAANESFLRRIDELTFSPFVVRNSDQSPNPVNRSHHQPSNPAVPCVPPVVPQRKITPVSQWKVKKYSGSDHGLELNEFLAHIEQLAISEHATDIDLFDSAVHLFDGPALSWYTACRNQRLLQSWPQLVHELKTEFRHPDLDSVLRTKIYQTRQQKGESFQQYYLQMNKLFQAMSHPMSDYEKLEVLKTNLRYDGRKALVGKNVTTLRELMTIGKDLDATDFSVFTKVFGPAKKENCMIESSGRTNSGTRTFVNQNRQNAPPQHLKTPRINNPNNTKTDSKPFPSSKQNQSGNSGNTEGHSTEPKAGTSKPSALLKLVSNYSPPEDGQCFNCRDYHNLPDCPIPRRVFCNRCALLGFTTNNCPFCLKNGLWKP